MPFDAIPVKEPGKGGNATRLNITAPVILTPKPGILKNIIISDPGTNGVINVTDSLGTPDLFNMVLQISSVNLKAGQVIDLNWPCLHAVRIAFVPVGSIISVS